MLSTDNHKIIIDYWEYPYLGILISQQDFKLYERIEKWVSKNKKKCIIDCYCLSFFTEYNDSIIKKYGIDSLMTGIEDIMDYMLVNRDKEYVITYKTTPVIKKHWMSSKNKSLFFPLLTTENKNITCTDKLRLTSKEMRVSVKKRFGIKHRVSKRWSKEDIRLKYLATKKVEYLSIGEA